MNLWIPIPSGSINNGQNQISVKLDALPIGNVEFDLGESLGILETYEKTFGVLHISSDFEIEISVETDTLVVGERIDFRLQVIPEDITVIG